LLRSPHSSTTAPELRLLQQVWQRLAEGKLPQSASRVPDGRSATARPGRLTERAATGARRRHAIAT
jgi:hypothetical protein